MQKFGRMQDPANWKDQRAMGGNPCLEQTLESYELCCLVEVFINNHEKYSEFEDTLKSAFLYAKSVTLGLPHWAETAEVVGRNRRIGTSLTGIVQFIEKQGLRKLKDWCNRGYSALKDYDKHISKVFGVPESIKITSVKPSGTVSLLAGASPGVHFPHSPYYLRRIRVPETDVGLLTYLDSRNFHMEDDLNTPCTKIVSVPVKSNCRQSARTVTMQQQLDLASVMQSHWADNQVSCTVSFSEQEAGTLQKALDKYQYKLKGVSFLPKLIESPYPQMPYEEISQEEYEQRVAGIRIRTEPDCLQVNEEQTETDKFCDSCDLNL